MSVTLEQLARVTRCSKATVSKALRDDRSVAPETRQRVQRAAREMNYDIRLARRGRPSGTRSVMRVGLVACMSDQADMMRDTNFLQFLNGAEREAAGVGAEVVIEIASQGALRCVTERRVDAVLLYGEQSARFIDTLGDLPVVLSTERMPDVAVTQVIKDNRHGAELATRHLLGLGHQKIVFLTHSDGRRWAIERARGYDAAMLDVGLPPIRYTASEPADQVAASLAAAALKRRPTAIVAGNDAIGLRVIRQLERKGVSVPQDISLVGFDHSASSLDWDGKTLTTIDAQVEQVGAEAIKMLRQGGGRHNQQAMTLTVPSRLIEGQTTASNR